MIDFTYSGDRIGVSTQNVFWGCTFPKDEDYSGEDCDIFNDR